MPKRTLSTSESPFKCIDTSPATFRVTKGFADIMACEYYAGTPPLR